MKATPSRRPDIFPEFKPLKPQLPQPMPGDPEVPNDEEEAEEKRQKVGCCHRAGGLRVRVGVIHCEGRQTCESRGGDCTHPFPARAGSFPRCCPAR